MYKILIDNGMTGLFVDNGLNGINTNDMIGFLINTDGIKELIDSIQIKGYYINTRNGYKEITKEQSMIVYDEILNYHKEQVKTI